MLQESTPVGLILAGIDHPWFDHTRLVAVETIFYVKPSADMIQTWHTKELLNRYKSWAYDKGCEEVQLTLMSSKYAGKNPLRREGFESFGNILQYKL
jgi:hypothetical protein